MFWMNGQMLEAVPLPTLWSLLPDASKICGSAPKGAALIYFWNLLGIYLESEWKKRRMERAQVTRV